MNERELDLLVAELETENKMMRERNERLQRELDIALDESARFKAVLARVIAVSELAFRDGGPQRVAEVGKEKCTHDDTASY
jgi:cell shape-determining protein MreC